MTDIASTFQRLEADIGELVARHDGGVSFERWEKYRDDPVGFIRDVLGETLTAKQVEIAEAFRDNRQLAVKGANGAGKDWASARLALWWTYCRRGLSVLSGPTERQVKEQLCRRELRRAFLKARTLPGDLFEMALRIEGHEQTGILAFTATDSDKFVGHHAPALAVFLTEGQGVSDDIYEAAQALMTGAESRLCVVGNSLRPIGRFFECFQSTEWAHVTISAFDHPNVQTGREVVKGAVTREWVEQIKREYGEDSPQYRSRVLAQFPVDAAEQLIKREWVDDAVRLWKQRRPEEWHGPAIFAVDVAHLGPDSTVLAIFQAKAVRELRVWRKLDTAQSADRIEADGKPLGRPVTILDATGLGWGVLDNLKARGWPVVPFIAAQSARDTERYANARSEAGWCLREMLEARRLPLPDDDELREELLAITWALDSQGRIALEPKEEIKKRLKRSPDKGDAVSMLTWHLWRSGRSTVLALPVGALSHSPHQSPGWRVDSDWGGR